ncbi:MAG: hypothetical protein ACMZ7B_00085 [Balneola sp.]
MRIILKSLLLTLLLFSGIQAQESAQLLFDQANTLLEDNEYSEAMKMYRSIEQAGSVSGALFLNMGITATQLDSMGLAKYYFLKSAKFELTTQSANEALEYVESQFSRQSATLPKLPWDRAVDWLKDGPGAALVFIIGFSFILIAVTLLLLKWVNIFVIPKFNATLSTFIISGVLIVLLSFYVDYIDQRYSEAVIITSEVQVRQAAAESADLVSLGYEGYAITVDHRTSSSFDGWLYIRLGNGQFGWIENQGIKIL